MPEPLRIILLILGILVGVYVIAVIIVGIVVDSLNRDIRRKEHALNVSMAQKFDLIISLGELMKENDIKIPKYIKKTIDIKDHENLKSYNTDEKLSIKTLLMKTVDTMLIIAEENGLEDNERYQILKKSIQDIDSHNRKDIALINSQIVAYNYWIRMWLYKPFALLLKYKKREIMY